MGQITEKIGLWASEIELNVRAKQLSRQREKNKKKLKNEQLKKACEIYFENTSEVVHASINKRADESDTMRAALCFISVKANRWCAYALYYMTYDEAELIDVNNEEGKFVNAIAHYFNFGKIYNNIPIGNIWDYDISFDNASGFLLSVEDLRKFSENEEIRKKIMKRKNSKSKMMNVSKESKDEENIRKNSINQSLDILKWEPLSKMCNKWKISICEYFPIRETHALQGDMYSCYKENYIGFREIETYNGHFLELIMDSGECDYMYHEKSLIEWFEKENKKKDDYALKEKLKRFYYSPMPIDDLVKILGVIFPKFDKVVSGDGINHLFFTRDVSFLTYASEGNFIQKEEVLLLDDVSLVMLDILCQKWKHGGYAQIFGLKPYEEWKNKMLCIEPALIEEMSKRYGIIHEKNAEDTRIFEEQQRKEEQKAKQEAGNAGEQEVEYQLKWLPKEYMAVEKKTSGILLAHPDFGNEKQEIDHIVVGPQGVFLIETKAYSGTIRIDAQGNWTRSKGDGIEEGLRNPVAQVNRHHLVVEKILGVSEIYDIICIANDKSIIGGAENSVVPVVKSDMLGHYISNYKKDSDKRYNEEEVKELKAKLESSMLENEA